MRFNLLSKAPYKKKAKENLLLSELLVKNLFSKYSGVFILVSNILDLFDT